MSNRETRRANRLTVSIALSDNTLTRPLIDGRIAPDGLDLIPSVLHGSEMFWRQLRFGDFDASEMSLASLFISYARGDTRWAAVPVYTMRRFFHTGILVRAGADIKDPADLAGKRVGVPEYQQTSAVWSRGILQEFFGVNPTEIEWYMERGADRSHGSATGFSPPRGIRLQHIPPGSDIGKMLLAGELDASLLYLNERNLVDRSRIDVESTGAVKRLFADPAAEGHRFYRATGLFPINHVVVVRRALLEQHSWIALNLYSAFVAAKEAARACTDAVLSAYVDTGLIARDCRDVIARDPMPYGLKSARRELETVARYVHQQGLTERLVALEEVFAPTTLDL